MEIVQFIYDALAWFAAQLFNLLKYVLDGVYLVVKGIAWLITSGVLTTVSGFVRGISFSSVIFQWAAAYAHLPAQAIYVMVATGVPECIALIGSAYVVRLLLNLIPSWATRV